MLKKILYEPLFHFLLLGGLLFLFYASSAPSEEGKNRIVISKERTEQLISDAEKKLLSVLTAEEKQKIIEQEVYEAVLYKEALKTGLEISDTDMKRHLVDKMAFVLYDTYELPNPSDETLKKFMLENSNDYREEETITFTQNMMDSDIDTFEKEYSLTLFETSTVFGRSFSEMLFQLEVNGKVHQLESDYGVHEVRIIAKPVPKVKDFESIKEKIKSDYLTAQREQNNKAIYEKLKSEYSISVEEK
ncbi:MAG: Unknown protein [uncultured Sulfurovum sp.]|uniref:PpiC domain-containing protein n=1 Tax=uncultured Sulfurovum sp. TaxID=269237 RepID=A0A6S6TEB0_9BACT|nr:MAG: Unknown protein [uncultured Sulfurovum sp.]